MEHTTPKFCVHCGKPILSDDLFCVSCGAKIESTSPVTEQEPEVELPPEPPRCSSCGTLLEDGDLFCISCGAPVASMNSQDTDTPQAAEPVQAPRNEPVKPSPKSMPPIPKKRLGLIVGSVLLLVVLSVGGYFILHKEPASNEPSKVPPAENNIENTPSTDLPTTDPVPDVPTPDVPPTTSTEEPPEESTIEHSENYEKYARYIDDKASYFSEETIEKISDYNAQFDSSYGSIVGVATVTSLNGENIEDFTYSAGNALGLGEGDMCFLIDAETQSWQVVLGNTLWEQISDDSLRSLETSFHQTITDKIFEGDADQEIIHLFEKCFSPWYEQIMSNPGTDTVPDVTEPESNTDPVEEPTPTGLGTTEDAILQEFKKKSSQHQGASFSVTNPSFTLSVDGKFAQFQFDAPASVSFQYATDQSYGDITIGSVENSSKITELANAAFLILSGSDDSTSFKGFPSQVWDQEPDRETYNHPDCAAGMAPLYSADYYKECVKDTYTATYTADGYTCTFYLYHDYIALKSGHTGDTYSGNITFTKG